MYLFKKTFYISTYLIEVITVIITYDREYSGN